MTLIYWVVGGRRMPIQAVERGAGHATAWRLTALAMLAGTGDVFESDEEGGW